MCPDLATLSALVDGEVEDPWKSRIERHIDQCEACRRRREELLQLVSLLREDREPDSPDSMARLGGRLAVLGLKRAYRVPLWRKRVVVPFPTVAVAALLMFMLGMSTLMLSFRSDYRSMSIRTQPFGTTEVKISAPIQELEQLLHALDRNASQQELLIRLPDEPKFLQIGEPQFVREADYIRGRQQ
jgi:hypothetical protein